MTTISNRNAERPDAQLQARATLKKMDEKAAVQAGRPAGLGHTDGVLHGTSVAAQLVAQASQTLQAAMANGTSPFAHLAGGKAVSGAELAAMATAVGLSRDVAPGAEVLSGLCQLEGLAAAQPEMHADVLGSLARVRGGTMLLLADAVATHTSEDKAPRAVVEQMAQSLVEAHASAVKAGETVDKKLQTAMAGAAAAMKSHFPLGMDVNLFVQAVLRECYLMQSEILEDFAKKVGYYNEQKKWLRDQLKKARETKLNHQDGDKVPAPLTLDPKTGEVLYKKIAPLVSDDGEPLSDEEQEQQRLQLKEQPPAFRESSPDLTAWMSSPDGIRMAVLASKVSAHTAVPAEHAEYVELLKRYDEVYAPRRELRVAYLEAQDNPAAVVALADALKAAKPEDAAWFFRALQSDPDGEEILGRLVTMLDLDGIAGQLTGSDAQALRALETESPDEPNVPAFVPESDPDALFNTQPTNEDPGPQTFNAAAWDDLIKELDETLQTIGDDAQLANVDLQNCLQQQQQQLQMISNISKTLHDTALAIVRKIGG